MENDIITLGEQLGIYDNFKDIILKVNNITYIYGEKYNSWCVSKHNEHHDLIYIEQSNKKWSVYDISYEEKTKLVHQTNSSGFIRIKKYKR
jgi:hypothetical protein